MRIEIGEGLEQPGAVLDAFAHADDAAAADLDACAPHALKRIQPVLIAARGDDLAVELSRGVEIVVVGGEPSLCQAVGLGLIEHAEGDAGLHVERAHAAHHGEHAVERLAVLHLAPGGAHAKAGGAGFFGDGRLGQHLVNVEALFALQPGALGVMGRLRAVFAVLGASPGLDRIEAGELHRAVGVMAAVHLPRLIDKVEQRLGQKGHDLAFPPIVAEAASSRRRIHRPSPPDEPCH